MYLSYLRKTLGTIVLPKILALIWNQYYTGELSEINECESILSGSGCSNGEGSMYEGSKARRESLVSMTSLDDIYETIPAQYISTLYGRGEMDTGPGATANEVYSMMQLSAGERNRQISISSEVNNAELMIR